MILTALKSAKRIWARCIVVSSLFAISCQDEVTVSKGVDNGQISFSITDRNTFISRSGESASFPSPRVLHQEQWVLGQDTLMFGVTEEKNESLIFVEETDSVTDEAETRGTPIVTGTLNKFKASAYLNNGNPYFQDEEQTVTDQTATSDRYWPDETLNFVAYAASLNYGLNPSFSVGTDGISGSFSYSLKDRTQATAQPDLLFAITPDQTKSAQAATGVALDFHHALAALVFKVGDVPKVGDQPQTLLIKSITLKNIRESGTCTVKHMEASASTFDTDSNDENVSFAWNSTDAAKKNFTQTFANKVVTSGGDIATGETTFLMIPQTLPADAELEMVCLLGNDREYTFVKKFSDTSLTEWKADHRYTFTIRIPDEVKIEISEDFTSGSNLKENVYVQNDGASDIYIRTTIVGVWVNGQGDALATWEAPDDISSTTSTDADGTFVLPSGWSDYWFRGSDGYYYYKSPVSYNQPTANLFDRYTLTATPPVVGTTLELSILAQSVLVSDIGKTGWPVEVGEDGKLSLKSSN